MIATINNSTENIHLAALESKIAKDNFETIIAEKDSKLYVVEDAGRIIAFMQFRVDDTSTVIYIDKLSIDRYYEKKGIDEHLYQKVERFAQKKGIRRLIATITTENANVHDFFERKGWVQDSGEYVFNMNY